MSDPHGPGREVDPVTGYDTTGHDWNGIKELNTPFPKIVIAALVLTFLYSVVAWLLLPAWPLGRDHTRGLLGLDQGKMAVASYRDMGSARQEWLAAFDKPDFLALATDRALMATAMPAARRLFDDNCMACHGTGATGGPGYPALNDADWLWRGDAETVAETIRVGINGTDPGTRTSQMPSFDWMSGAERQALADFVAALPAGVADWSTPAAALFAENCAACHGDRGEGGLEVGAPSLADGAVIYGQDSATVMKTLKAGRVGVMPSWSERLSPREINLLALYVAQLGSDGKEPVQ